MSEEIAKPRVRSADLQNELNQIVEHAKAIRVIVDNLPASSMKDAFEYSAENLEKKIEKFQPAPELTKEQKEAIALIKSGTISPEKVLSVLSALDQGQPTETKGKKKKSL